MFSGSVSKFGIPLMEDERDPVKVFLPEKLAMIDCEMDGVVAKRDDILQIAICKLKLDGNSYSQDGEPLVIYVHNGGQPKNDFHKKYLSDIFKKCNESKVTYEDAKKQISDWLGEYKGCVVTGDAIQSDMFFMIEKGVIEVGDIVDGEAVSGTFHYEMFDINPIKCVARTKIGQKENKEELGLDDGIHDALVDCQNQLKELNYFLSILL
jgi:oligoribonuclease (3'-5' exoribonuclease)